MYNSLAPEINTIESVVSGRRVFVGNQPDDFALAGWLAGGAARISLLGLGYGGAIRPILATARHARITGVDNSRDRVADCQRYFQHYFPDISFIATVEDAWNYLRDNQKRLDALCVDVYDDGGYLDFLFEPSFWARAAGAIGEHGTLLVNSWGLPWQLDPWRRPSPLPELVSALRPWFPSIRYVKNRRNVTLICGMRLSPALDLRLVKVDATLERQDQIIARCMAMRYNVAEPAPEVGSTPSAHIPRLRTEINAEMLTRWGALPGTFRTTKALSQGCESVRDILSDPARAWDATLELLARGAVEADLLPIVAAGGHFEGNSTISEWYGAWVVENFEGLIRAHAPWAWAVAIWQALCIAAYPFAPRPQWAEELLDICESEIRCEQGVK